MKKAEDLLEEKIIHSESCSGGCINDVSLITTESQKKYILKIQKDGPDNLFETEAKGLNELGRSRIIGVPQTIGLGDGFLLLEYLPPDSASPSSLEQFGRNLARLHQFRGEAFGLDHNNYCGLTPQLNENPGLLDWKSFYFENRLKFQFLLAEKKGLISTKMRNEFKRLEQDWDEILNYPEGDEPPCLIHGDLWSGNYHSSGGEIYLIDPAIYYGHREAELAMTELFGSFPQDFYRGYEDEYPLQAGYRERLPYYKLYHVLNHLNLFGGSYAGQALELIQYRGPQRESRFRE